MCCLWILSSSPWNRNMQSTKKSVDTSPLSVKARWCVLSTVHFCLATGTLSVIEAVIWSMPCSLVWVGASFTINYRLRSTKEPETRTAASFFCTVRTGRQWQTAALLCSDKQMEENTTHHTTPVKKVKDPSKKHKTWKRFVPLTFCLY